MSAFNDEQDEHRAQEAQETYDKLRTMTRLVVGLIEIVDGLSVRGKCIRKLDSSLNHQIETIENYISTYGLNTHQAHVRELVVDELDNS